MTAKERLALLIKAANDADLVILPHSNPDPDAIASVLTLQYIFRERLGLDTDIAYQGIIGRAENRALVRYLDHTLQPSTALHLSGPMSVALVDTQPNAGNVILPPESGVAIVIDHHDQDELLDTAVYPDVRPDLGATSTILVEYLQAAAIAN